MLEPSANTTEIVYDSPTIGVGPPVQVMVVSGTELPGVMEFVKEFNEQELPP